MGLKASLMSLGRVCSKNAPAIFTGLAIAGAIGSSILMYKAVKRSVADLEEERILREEETKEVNARRKEKLGEVEELETAPITFRDELQLTWHNYIPTFISLSATVACIFAAQHINMRRQAALISAIDLAQTTFTSYREKVIDQIGKNKEAAIEHEIAEERIQRAISDERNRNQVQSFTSSVTEGDLLFFDPKTGQIFRSTYDRVIRASQEVNARLKDGAISMEVPLQDWLLDIGARADDATCLYNQVFIPIGFGTDAIDIEHLFDPHEEVYCGVKTIIVHLNYDIHDRLLL